MHDSKTYIEDFHGKTYAVQMLQHTPGGTWTIDVTLFDGNGRKIGLPWHDAGNSYDTEDEARAAGARWAEAKLG